MRNKFFLQGIFLNGLMVCCLALFISSGCTSKDTDTSGSDSHGEDGHAHDDYAGHDHSAHVLGPNLGHFFDIDGLEMKCEWSHDDEYNNVRIHFLDADNREAFVDAPNVTLISEGKETVEYELLPEMEPNEEGKHSVYVKKSAPLLGAMAAGVKVKVTIDGTEYNGTIEPHIH